MTPASDAMARRPLAPASTNLDAHMPAALAARDWGWLYGGPGRDPAAAGTADDEGR